MIQSTGLVLFWGLFYISFNLIGISYRLIATENSKEKLGKNSPVPYSFRYRWKKGY